MSATSAARGRESPARASRPRSAAGDGDTGQPGHAGQHQVLGQGLAQQAAAIGAEGGVDRPFPAAPHGHRQQQVDGIADRDQQEQPDTAGQHRQRAAHRCRHHLRQRRDIETARGHVLPVCGHQAAGQGIGLLLRLGQA